MAQQCTPVPEKGRYSLTTSGLRLTTSCSRWTKPGVCVRLTRIRIRAWLREIDDEQLSSSLGLTPEDIAILRSTD
jgi:hypothetical protein